MESPLPRNRLIALPAIVVLLGMLISIGVFARVNADARRESSEHLAETGAALVRYAEVERLNAVGRAVATEGLFESSLEVTAEQFTHFAETIRKVNGTGIAYAPRVLAADFDLFVAEARQEFQTYAVRDTDFERITAQPGGVYWPLLYTWGMSKVGFARGFDFGSDAIISEAIETSLLTGQPAASVFLTLPGEDQPSDFAIVTVVGPEDDPDGIAVVTLPLAELLNQRIHDVLGLQATVTLSQTAVNGLDEADPDQSLWVGSTTIQGQPLSITIDSNKPIAESSIAPWLLGLGIGSSALLGWADYGRRKRAALSQRLISLEQALADKDRFLASISHAVRTPMTAVVGALEILNDDQTQLEPSLRATLLRDARVSALDLERMTDDYLTAARISSGAITLKSHLIDLDTLITRIVDSTDIPNGLTISVEPLGRCHGDMRRVQHIVRNLVRNAIQHALTTITIRSHTTSKALNVEFINDGQPIPAEVASIMFTPFAKGTVLGQPESIGLGLSVARDLARMMGGNLTHRDEGGQVTFELSMPLPQATSEIPTVAAAAS